ncbi:MAG: hypothetical protein GY862_22295, partial [Gammaproteobacteria bacterium]|nr:hypothetical protein [Gammaproteobacteria bacterium]
FFNVPSRNPRFTGRQEEVTDFIKRVLQGGAFAICGVKGMGGIGKSEIAREVCHLFHETWKDAPRLPDYAAKLLAGEQFFSDGILWIQFERENQSPKVLIEYVAKQLMDAPAAKKIDRLDGLVELLAQKDVLMVFDSVEQNLRTFDYVFERCKGRFPLIITSRIEIIGIHAVDINALKDDEAEALFISHLPQSTADEGKKAEIRALCKVLGNFPLALKIIASRVDAQVGNLTELKESYQKNRTALLEETGLNTGIEKRNADVKTCFALSYNDQEEFAQKVFKHAAVFNNPFTVAALAALLDDAEESEMQRIVERLVRFSLINRLKDRDSPVYDLHPLMREFALDLLMKTARVVSGEKERIAALLEQLTQAKKRNTLLELLEQDPSLVAQITDAMRYCDGVFDFATVLKLMDAVNEPLNTLGFWSQKIELNRLTVRAAVALQNRYGEAFYREKFADTVQRQAAFRAEFETARQAFARALRIYRELKYSDDVLYTQYRLANIEKNLHQLKACIISNYQGIRDACQYEDFYCLGAFSRTIGWICKDFLNDKALSFFCINFKLAAHKTEQTFQKENLLRAYDDIIETWYAQGKISACLPYHQRQLQLAQQLKVLEEVAESIQDLFNCHLQLQELEPCRAYLEEYQQLSRAMGMPESRRQFMRGQFAWLDGDYAGAIAEFSAALTEDGLGLGEKFWLGKAYLYHGDLDAAESCLSEVLKHFREQKNAVEMARVYTQQALLELKRGQAEAAALTLACSLKTQQTHGVAFFPEEERIKKNILEQLAESDYETIAARAESIDLTPDFILKDLPPARAGKDGKTMLLIAEGPVF